MLLASISKHGSVNWKVNGNNIDIETIVKIQLFAESIAHYQSIKENSSYENNRKAD